MPGLIRTASIVFISCCCALGLSLPAQAVESLKLATLNNFTSRVNGVVLREVYRRAGIDLEIIPMPPSRVTAVTTSGMVDGEVNRIRSYGDQHPTLVRVEPPLNFWTISAFYKADAPFEIRRASDFSARQVGIVRGLKATADLTAANNNVSIAPSSRELMLMLSGGRFEVAIDGEVESGFYIRKLGLKGINSVVLEKHALYHYLNEKNKKLVPLISREIEKMIESGDLARVYAKAVNDLLASGAEP